MFVVLSGEIGINIRIPAGTEKEIASFKTGHFFGEMSIFEQAPRSAGARSKSESHLLSLDDKALLTLIEKHPRIAVAIMRKMLNITTHRLQETNRFVGDIIRWGDLA